MPDTHQNLLEGCIEALKDKDFEKAREKLQKLIKLNDIPKHWIFSVPNAQKDFLEDAFGIETLNLASPKSLAKEFEIYMQEQEELENDYEPVQDSNLLLQTVKSNFSSQEIVKALNQLGAFSMQPQNNIEDTSSSLNKSPSF